MKPDSKTLAYLVIMKTIYKSVYLSIEFSKAPKVRVQNLPRVWLSDIDVCAEAACMRE